LDGLGSQVGLLVLDGLIWCCVLVPRPSRKGPAGRAWPSSKGPAACVRWPYKYAKMCYEGRAVFGATEDAPLERFWRLFLGLRDLREILSWVLASGIL